MMTGFYAQLAALELARAELRLQEEEAQRRNKEMIEQQAAFNEMTAAQRRYFDQQRGDVIDVEAREVKEPLALPAPKGK